MHIQPIILSLCLLLSSTILADTNKACYQHQGQTFCISQNGEAQSQQQWPDTNEQHNLLGNSIFEDNNGNSTRCLTDSEGNRSCTSQNGNITRTHTKNIGNSSSQLHNNRVIRNVSERMENSHRRSADYPSRHCYKTTSGKMECR